MKTLLLLLALPIFSQAATLSPASCGPATITPGQTVNCSAVLAGAGAQVSACQATITTSSPVGVITVSATGAALAASKTSAAVANKWLVSGINQSAMADGALITFSFPTLASTPQGSFTIGLITLACSDPAGNLVATTANPPQSISVSSGSSPNACDLNGDGQVTSLDYDKARANLLATPPIPNFGTAAPTIMDVQIVANAVGGASCAVLQPPPTAPTLVSFTCSPSIFPAGASSTCSPSVSSAAPTGGIIVSLSSVCPVVRILASVTIPVGATTAQTTVNTSSGVPPQSCNVSASYGGITQTATLTLQ